MNLCSPRSKCQHRLHASGSEMLRNVIVGSSQAIPCLMAKHYKTMKSVEMTDMGLFTKPQETSIGDLPVKPGRQRTCVPTPKRSYRQKKHYLFCNIKKKKRLYFFRAVLGSQWKTERHPTHPFPHTGTAVPTINAPLQSGTFVMTDGPTPTHRGHPKSIVCAVVLSWCHPVRVQADI